MSITAAVGRIGQILQLEQTLLNPASLAASASTSSDGGAALPTNGGSLSSTNFAATLANAQGTSSTGAATDSGGVSVTGASAPAQVQAMTNEANSLVRQAVHLRRRTFRLGHTGWL
jgi:hypothetical protein